MAEAGRYRRDDSLSPSLSPSPSPPPQRKRRSPVRDRERDTRERLRDDDRDRQRESHRPPRDDHRLSDRERDHDRERDRDRDRHRDRDRDSPMSPPEPAFKRQSFTDRIRNSWNARKEGFRESPPPHPPPNSAAQRHPNRVPSRRASSASAGPPGKASPMAKVRDWLDMCNSRHGDHCSGSPIPPSTPSANGPPHSDDESDLDLDRPDKARHSAHDAGADGDLTSSWRPIWLIDAVDRTLVRSRVTDRYIALSYVNEPPPGPSAVGRHAPRDTRRENLDMMTGSIDDADMPQAIADAMWLARRLGIRLLWVDRFCIVQDDDVEREQHVRNMGYVFANAYLVVVAAAGEGANTGLSALIRPDGRAPPPVPKAALGPPGRKGHEEMVMQSRWRERCWTMQEGFYARRVLFVFDDTMTWECHCETWNLAGDAPGGPVGGGLGSAGGAAAKVPGLQRVLSLRGGTSGGASASGSRSGHQHHRCTARVYPATFGFRHPPWPDMDEYARICMEYSTRRLSLIDDTASAFRGFTTVLSKSFAGGFVFGMPVLFLDVALLWRPAATIRRKQIVPTIDSGGMNPLPSWSWMGWFSDGVPVDLTLWRAAADYVVDAASGSSHGKGGGGPAASAVEKPGSGHAEPRRRYRNVSGFRVRTICQFHITDRATTAPLRNDGMRFRNARQLRKSSAGGGGGLPPGWSRGGGGGFKHLLDPGAVFRYPVPLASDIPASELPISGEVTYPGTLLSFNTTRAFLDVDFASPFPAARDRDKDKGSGIPLAVGNIWAPRSGRWIGTLRSHDAWLGVQGANYESEERLELVAVSEGSEREGPAGAVFGEGAGLGAAAEDAIRGHANQNGVVEFVNVLGVERVGGVCYRRGVGHVLLRAWEAAAGRDRIEILLG